LVTLSTSVRAEAMGNLKIKNGRKSPKTANSADEKGHIIQAFAHYCGT